MSAESRGTSRATAARVPRPRRRRLLLLLLEHRALLVHAHQLAPLLRLLRLLLRRRLDAEDGDEALEEGEHEGGELEDKGHEEAKAEAREFEDALLQVVMRRPAGVDRDHASSTTDLPPVGMGYRQCATPTRALIGLRVVLCVRRDARVGSGTRRGGATYRASWRLVWANSKPRSRTIRVMAGWEGLRTLAQRLCSRRCRTLRSGTHPGAGRFEAGGL